jgi:UDP-N-acetylglucosamine transferase subunit ALG13
VIFVTVGTNEARFDRLLHAVDALAVDEEIVVQCGASPVRPANAHCMEFLHFDDLVEHVRRARVVVAHAGVGTVLVALANGHRSIVVPRRQHYGEAVDDHQVDFARRLHDVGLVHLVEDPFELEEALRMSPEPPAANGHANGLADDLQAYLVGEMRPTEAVA